MPTEANTLADFTRHPKWFPYDKHVSQSYPYNASIIAVADRCGPQVLANTACNIRQSPLPLPSCCFIVSLHNTEYDWLENTEVVTNAIPK